MGRTDEPTVIVEKLLTLDSLPSGSGLAVEGEHLYICGDDSPYLFQLTKDYEISNKHLLLKRFAELSRIPKKDKPDFESMAAANWQDSKSLLIFGSGSKSPERDLFVVATLPPTEQPKTYSLSSFYDAIAHQEGTGREELNIEGAVQLGQKLWLFNRGSNGVITINWDQFSKYIKEKSSTNVPSFELHHLKLPEIGGKQARFSGACDIRGTNQILFTATVEDTDNWIDDGEILGSYIGLLDMSNLQQGDIQHSWLIKDQDGAAMKIKLESIDVLTIDDEGLTAVAIADNDEGDTQLLELRIKNFAGLIK